MINIYKCQDGCCTYKVTPYKDIKWNNGDGWKSNSGKIIKAGSFVVDPETHKILLVQSRGKMWGPPKGTIQDNESVEDCAIREVFEETGILLKLENFKQEMKILSQEIDKLLNSKESKILEEKLDTFTNDIKEETALEQFKHEWTKNLQENKQKIDKTIKTKNEMTRKISSTEFLLSSADLTGLEDNEVDKIYSIEVFQHIEDFNALAAEIKRILAPDGIVSFCAHLSTSHSSYNKLRQENLLIDEIEILVPVDEVARAFKNNGFNVDYHSIGEHVFEKYDQWVTQSGTTALVSHNIYNSYKSGYIEYYVFVMNKLAGEINNTEMPVYNKDEL